MNRERPINSIRIGDVVVRRNRLLKTIGTVVRLDAADRDNAARAWVKWDHPNTLPNPSRVSVDDLERVHQESRAV